jgi:hypothetical protein
MRNSKRGICSKSPTPSSPFYLKAPVNWFEEFRDKGTQSPIPTPLSAFRSSPWSVKLNKRGRQGSTPVYSRAEKGVTWNLPNSPCIDECNTTQTVGDTQQDTMTPSWSDGKTELEISVSLSPNETREDTCIYISPTQIQQGDATLASSASFRRYRAHDSPTAQDSPPCESYLMRFGAPHESLDQWPACSSPILETFETQQTLITPRFIASPIRTFVIDEICC